ncbi:15355_t:CDS:2, partial [Cetraspora pellucida]
ATAIRCDDDTIRTINDIFMEENSNLEKKSNLIPGQDTVIPPT